MLGQATFSEQMKIRGATALFKALCGKASLPDATGLYQNAKRRKFSV
jgi:hypothetical protein